MRFKIVALFSFILIILLSCNNEKQRYSDIKKDKNLDLAYKFKSKYPKSKYSIDSLILALEYRKLLYSPSIDGYKKFLSRTFLGFYGDSALLQLSILEWDKIGKNGSNQQISDYLEKYPNSPYLSQAEGLLFINASSGKFTDKRDNHTYSWEKVGDQIWMTEPLRFREDFSGHMLYNSSELVKACPIGWRIPTSNDWEKVIEYYTKERVILQVSSMRGNRTFFSNIFRIYKNHPQDWSFWTLLQSDPNSFYGMLISKADERYGDYNYTLMLNEKDESDKCYVLCIKDSKNGNIFDSTQWVKDICGTKYRTIKVGNKIWMDDDLSTYKFANGDLIPTTNEPFCDENKPIYQWSNGIYGSYYTGYAVQDERNICPNGWHVATENEWSDAMNIQKNNGKEMLTISRLGYKECNDKGVLNPYYWTSTVPIITTNISYKIEKDIPKNNGLLVKCVKN